MRNKLFLLLLVFLLIKLLFGKSYAEQCNVLSNFSPTQDIPSSVITQIQDAKKSIHLSLYGITNKSIADALIERKKAGLDIIVCVDKTQSVGKNSLNQYLIDNNISVVVKKSNILEHNKYMIIDNSKVLVGSWNFSNSAEKQDNSQVIIDSCPNIINSFEQDFQRIYKRDKT